MDYSTLTSDDFLLAAQNLLPRGAAFPRSGSSTLTSCMRAVADLAYDLHLDIVNVFGNEADPNHADALLPDWQAAFAVLARGTADQQHTQLVAAIADPGGFAASHYVALGASLGITITTQVTGRFAWMVHAPSALSAEDRSALEALISAHNRASCIVSFAYDL